MEDKTLQDQEFKTARNKSEGFKSRGPVDTVTSLDMSDHLRAMLKSAQSSPVLQHVYMDLRGRLYQVTSSLSSFEILAASVQPLSLQATQAQEQSLDLKQEVDALREVVHELFKNTSQEASAPDADILTLRSRLDGIKENMLNQDYVATQVVPLLESTSANQDNVNHTLEEIRDLRELFKNLTTENTLLRGYLHTLETRVAQLSHVPTQVPPFPDIPTRRDQTHPVRASPARQDRREQVLRPPTFEELMRSTHIPYAGPMSQVQTILGPALNPLNTAAAQVPLVTTCNLPTTAAVVAPSPLQAVPQVANHVQEDPYCPGLIPHVPMLTPFKLVVSYRHYRLKDTRAVLQDWESEQLYKIKLRFDSLYPTFEVFDGAKPIKLLEFLTVLREGFDALRVSEALAALALAYYLDGQAKTHYTALASPGVRTTSPTLGGTWPSLVDSLIKRYLTDDVLQAAHDKITDAKRKTRRGREQVR